MRIQRSFQHTICAAAFAFAALAASAFADTVILKSGEKIEGKILEETAAQVTVEYQPAPGISDTRTVQKAEIDKIEKVTPDEVAFAAIKGAKPGASSLPAASYEPLLARLRAFAAQFPQSAHAAEVQAQLTAFEEEKKRVDAGEVKLNGRWLSKDEAQKERVQIGGQVILAYMQDQVRRGDLVGAMNSFGQLEAGYLGSRAYPDAVDLVKQILPRLKASADQTLRNWLQTRAQREKGIQLAREPEKSEMIAANDREQKQADAAIEAATRKGNRYPPLLANSEKALTEISAKATEDTTRLAQLPVAQMRASIQQAEKAREQMAKGEFEAADASLSAAASAWSENELVARLQNENSAKRTAASAPPPTPAAEEPPPAPESADPASNLPKVGAATPPADAPAPAVAQQPSGDEQPAPEPAAEEEESKSFFATPFGWIVTLVVLIAAYAAWSAYKKVQARANEIVE